MSAATQRPSAARPKDGFNSKLAIDSESRVRFDVACCSTAKSSPSCWRKFPDGGGAGMIKTKGILHVTIPVSDPTRSRAFYTDILGLDFVGQAPKDNPPFVFLN